MPKFHFLCKCLLLYFCVLYHPTSAQKTDTLNKKRLYTVIGGLSATYTIGMTGLYQLWYKNSPQAGFHFLNDNKQWLQVDKFGHFYTAFHLSTANAELFRWAGLQPNNAALWGGIGSQLLMTTIEVFDGFSSEYGASWGDLTANFSGSLFYYGQRRLWGQSHLHPKFSFYQSSYAPLRPQVLGGNLIQQILKDYNGQTYWLSVDMAHFLCLPSCPKWLNVSVGIGGKGMLYGNPKQNEQNGYYAARQYYLGIDIHLANIPTKNKFLKKVFSVFGTIRLPAPTLSYERKKGIQGHWLYF